MPPCPYKAQSEVDRLFTSARAGSNSCLGRLLTLYTNYLKLLVAAQLDHRLRVRVSPSDIVQETFFEAHRDFEQFRGQSTGEFVAWLRKIVVNNILRVVEQHVLAEKRDVRREVSLEEIGRRLEQSTVRLETLLAVEGDSPSGCAVRNEHEILLADALAALPRRLPRSDRAAAHRRPAVRRSRPADGAIGRGGADAVAAGAEDAAREDRGDTE